MSPRVPGDCICATMATTVAPAARSPLDESVARGKAARKVTPRSAHADWVPSAGRADPVAVLEDQAATRVPELVPIRYGRMLASPFSFYRGAAAVMAADLASTPVSGIGTHLCGDAHLSNFGVYASPDRRLVFDLNDFDETLAGPWEWDLKRLVASFEIAGRDRGLRSRKRRDVVHTAARTYREGMRDLAGKGNLAVWYAHLDVDDAVARISESIKAADRRRLDRGLQKARSNDSTRALTKLTERVDGRVRFRSEPPLLVRVVDLLPAAEAHDLEARFSKLLDDYAATLAPELGTLVRRYRVVDMARKVVGVGSVGTRAWVVLLEGRDEADPLVLQAKEAQASVLEAHLEPSPQGNHGERVVQGQRYLQAASDILLGWDRTTGLDDQLRDFYVRQLWDGKAAVTVEAMTPDAMATYARLCGWTLARAHARSGDRVAIASYLGASDTFDRAMGEFAIAYAEQNDLDFRALEAAVDDGRVAARGGV
jgi:uncharacterized protein (DUF2252 family)